MAGTTFTGPLTIEAAPTETDFNPLVALTDDSGGTPDTTTFELETISGTFNQSEIANDFATLAAAINRIIERIK